MKRVYKREALNRINAQIPSPIVKEMNRHGWDALGIFEIVEDELKRVRHTNKHDKADAYIQPKCELCGYDEHPGINCSKYQ